MVGKLIAYQDMNIGPGRVRIYVSDKAVTQIKWVEPKGRLQKSAGISREQQKLLDDAEHELAEYVRGGRQSFSVNFETTGTDFQKRVWAALRDIPFGETVTYGEIAQAIGHPKAVRAVGGANNKNPLSILTPCHRVIGASGKLTGYAGGLNVKAWLLELEKVYLRKVI